MDESAHFPLQFYATAPYACSYLDGKSARSQVASPGELIDTRVYSMLMERGFRRSGLFTYRPHCDGCQDCQTLRIPVAEFKHNRSQRRAWSQHQRLAVRMVPPTMQAEHFKLYQRYLKSRHSNGGMDNDNPVDYEQFLLRSRVDTRLLEFRAPAADGQQDGLEPAALRMVSVVDVLEHGLSAVYTFYDDGAASGLGTYSILWLLEWAGRLNLPYVYLGYWIAGSAKMAYKSHFLPHEVLDNGLWRRVQNRPTASQR